MNVPKHIAETALRTETQLPIVLQSSLTISSLTLFTPSSLTSNMNPQESISIKSLHHSNIIIASSFIMTSTTSSSTKTTNTTTIPIINKIRFTSNNNIGTISDTNIDTSVHNEHQLFVFVNHHHHIHHQWHHYHHKYRHNYLYHYHQQQHRLFKNLNCYLKYRRLSLTNNKNKNKNIIDRIIITKRSNNLQIIEEHRKQTVSIVEPIVTTIPSLLPLPLLSSLPLPSLPLKSVIVLWSNYSLFSQLNSVDKHHYHNNHYYDNDPATHRVITVTPTKGTILRSNVMNKSIEDNASRTVTRFLNNHNDNDNGNSLQLIPDTQNNSKLSGTFTCSSTRSTICLPNSPLTSASTPSFSTKSSKKVFWTLLYLFFISTATKIIENEVKLFVLVEAISLPYHHHSQQHQQSIQGPQQLKPYSNSINLANHHRHDLHYPFERAQQNFKRDSSTAGSLSSALNNENSSCINCRLKLNRTQAEHLKLNAIKQQILSKLNLKHRPNITGNQFAMDEAIEIIRKAKLDYLGQSSPKQYRFNNEQKTKKRRHQRRESDDSLKLIHWKTLSSANGQTLFNNNEPLNDEHNYYYDDNDDNDDNNVSDEYFGKTSEIIIFAKPDRKLNGHILVTLLAPDNFYKLNVSNAIFWLRLLLNRRLFNRMDPEQKEKVQQQSVKLYLFKVANTTSTTANSNYYNQQFYPTPFFQMNRSSFNQPLYDSNEDSEENIAESTRLSFQLLATHRLAPIKNGWIKLNLTSAVHDWFDMAANALSLPKNRKNNLVESNLNQMTLLIDCAGCNDLISIDLGNTSIVDSLPHYNYYPHYYNNNGYRYIRNLNQENFHSVNENKQTALTIANGNSNRRKKNGQRKHGPRRHFRPFLVLTTESRSKHRGRRHAYNCEDGIRQCCKQSLYVNFEELGWNDWIIYPRGYYANYCMGECVQMRTPDMLAYFHSHVLEEYRIKNPYASITPCCAPTKLSSISLIYFDQNRHIIKADLPKMVVNECGCT